MILPSEKNKLSIESNVKSYCNIFSSTFESALGTNITDNTGRTYLDFLSGCGSLNYGHNHPELESELLNYIKSQGIVMSMDFYTTSKLRFLDVFKRYILETRDLDYRIQFAGPTGTNAIEAAIKLARKVTERSNILSFTNGFHGCTLGSLALTGNKYHRGSSAAQLTHVHHIPYDGYFGPHIDTSEYLEKLLLDPSSGYDLPAAIIFETIQGEGGVNMASAQWAQDLQRIAKTLDILLIVDDIQAGCGRSGNFFSFEALDIEPDIVCLAKAISGYGLPMSLVLLKPEYDIWDAGEHNGTFRGNNYAFVTAAKAIELFWSGHHFQDSLIVKSQTLAQHLAKIADQSGFQIKGRGLFKGIELGQAKLALAVQQQCFESGLILEICGPKDTVIKLLPPLTVTDQELALALSIIESSILFASEQMAVL